MVLTSVHIVVGSLWTGCTLVLRQMFGLFLPLHSWKLYVLTSELSLPCWRDYKERPFEERDRDPETTERETKGSSQEQDSKANVYRVKLSQPRPSPSNYP